MTSAACVFLRNNANLSFSFCAITDCSVVVVSYSDSDIINSCIAVMFHLRYNP